ncbi:class I SAM-dependent methyltransferase [Ornithinimicrobium sp. W1679]|uniref:class I SAM-dependent methyltransferase n=1 Tax=unclassified Ornithinimicrobium TaxID=2615080 RepID=UPI003CEBD3DD
MSPPQDHYFTARPASDGELRRVPVRLAGRDVEVVTAGGIFSPDGIDRGTRVLLAEVPPPPPEGSFLDLGCGWGPLALTMALESPGAHVLAVDVNERALDLARRNAVALDVADRVEVLTPEEVPAERRFDLLWSNPPIRVGKEVLHGMLTAWLPRLAPEGTAYLVVQKNLGADSLQTWLQTTLPDRMGPVRVTREASSKGFRVLCVRRG